MDIQAEKSNRSASRLAKASLVLSIASILGLVLIEVWLRNLGPTSRLNDILEVVVIPMWTLSVPALIVGIIALRKMKERGQGRGFAVAGIFLGAMCFLIFPFIFFAFLIGG